MREAVDQIFALFLTTINMYEALYCSMMYRRKKIKSFQEGFVERRDRKLVLLDENRKVIESIFSSETVCEGLEIDFDQNYCLVGDPARSASNPIVPPSLPPVQAKRRIGLKRSSASICGPLKSITPSEASGPSKPSAQSQTQSCRPLSKSKATKKSRLSIQDVLLFENKQSQEENTVIVENRNDSLSSHSRTSEKPEEYTAAVVPQFVSTVDEESRYEAPPPVFKPKTDAELLSYFLGEDDENEIGDDDQSHQVVENTDEPDPLEFQKNHSEIVVEHKQPPVAAPKALPRKPLLSKFTIPPTSGTSFQPASFSQPISGPLLRPRSETLYASLRPNSYNLVFQPSSSALAASQQKQGYQMRQYQQSCRLFRERTIPNRFKDVDEYSKILFSSITELINLELADLRRSFDKVRQKTESDMRSSRISYYAGVSLKSTFSSTATGSSSSDAPNLLLSFSNKEHHSLYSKDDIWIVSNDSSMKNAEFFRSVYYGTSSGGDCVEISSLSPNPNSCGSWMGNPNITLYAVRAFNANSECLMLDMLGSEFFRETRLVKEILQKSMLGGTTAPARITEKEIVESKRLVLDECADDFVELFEDAIEEHSLNDDQAKVIRNFSLSLSGRQACPIVLAHGVYGAGKSFLIAVLILTLEKANRLGLFALDTVQVVFSSMTNVAVDRILLTLLEKDFNDFARVGSIKKIAKPILNYTCSKSKSNDLKELNEMLSETEDEAERQEIQNAIKRFQQSTHSLLDDTFLIGITCSATNFEVLGDIKCPIVILDECSQMTEPMSLLPIVRFRAEYALLVGDPKQLAPTLSHSLDPSLVKSKSFGIERTLFERLSDAGISLPILLSRQYRCHPQISRLSNHLFYDNRLKNGANVGQLRSSLIASLGPLAFVRVEGGQETKSGNGSFKNDAEITLITKIVSSLLNSQVTPDQIGCISLYKGQAELIESSLKSAGVSGVQAATVDSFQGSEKDVIIVSTVRSTSSSFLEDPRRVNVALTRAKRHLIILACDGMANGSKLWRQIQVLSADANPGVIPSRAFLALLNSPSGV